MSSAPNRAPEGSLILRPDPAIIQRDDGQYQIGLGDGAAGPFVTRQFAESVATASSGAVAAP